MPRTQCNYRWQDIVARFRFLACMGTEKSWTDTHRYKNLCFSKTFKQKIKKKIKNF